MAIQKFADNSSLDTTTNVVTDKTGKTFAPTTITPESLAPANTVNFNTPPTATPYPVDTLNTATATLTAPEQKVQTLSDKVQEINNQLLGKSAYTTQQKTAQGIPELIKTQNDLTARLKTIQNEAQAIPLQIQQEAGGGTTARGLAPLETARLRANAIQALTTSSLLETYRGNLTTAQTLVDRAVSQKYDPILEQLNTLKENLQIIKDSPEYSLADKNRAQAQLDLQTQKEADILKKKEDATTIYNTANEAAKNGADATTLDKINNAKTPAEALSIASASGFYKTPDPTSIQEINGRKLLINSKTGQTIKDLGSAGDGNASIIQKYPDAGILPTDDNTAIQEKLKNSSIYKKDIATSADKFSQAKDAMGNNLAFNSATGKYTDSAGNEVKPATTPQGTGLLDQQSVDSFLQGKNDIQINNFKNMDDTTKSDVMQLVNGDVLLNDLMTSRGIAGSQAKQQLLMQARSVDPNFSENENKQRYAFKTKWNDPNGKSYLARNSMNTAMEHLGELKGIVTKMSNSGIPVANKISNIVKKNVGDPNVTDFNYTLGVLANEIASAYKGGSATDQEIATEREAITNYFSNSQLNSVIDLSTKLLTDKIASTGQEYKNTMGEYTSEPLIHPSTIENLRANGVNVKPVMDTMIKQGMKAPTINDYVSAFPDKLNSAVQIKKENPSYTDDDILQILQPSFSPGSSGTPIATLKEVSKANDGTEGGQCGRFVNKLTGLGLGDSYQSKISKMNPSITQPAPGMVFVMPYKDTGHTGFIVGVKDGIATVKDSNYSLDEKIKTHQIPVSKMTGFTYA